MASKKFNIEKQAEALVNGVQKMHDLAIDTTSELVDNSIKTGTKFQKLASTMVKESAPLREKQIDLALSTAEGIKDQVQYGVKRFNKLAGFGNAGLVGTLKDTITKNSIVTKVTEVVNETALPLVDMLVAKGEEVMEPAVKRTKKAVKSVNKTAKKSAKKTAKKVTKKVNKTKKAVIK